MASIDKNQDDKLNNNLSQKQLEKIHQVSEFYEIYEVGKDYSDSDFSVGDYTHLSMQNMVKEAENIVNPKKNGNQTMNFAQLCDGFNAKKELNNNKEVNSNEYNPNNLEDYSSSRSNGVCFNVLKEKQENDHIEGEYSENLVHKRSIIEKLKKLYTNTEPGTNLFKAIREIKDEWQKSGQVSKSEFKTLNNDYFYHLSQFYLMLDLNKEYLEQEYAHNLQKRKVIIARAKELKDEPIVQKALNELQYLHKLWKEEAEPVGEEFRDSTWEEFKEISNLIHQKKTELFSHIEANQKENLEKKNQIIENIKNITNSEKVVDHSYWQFAIKKVEELRNEFIALGSVPKKKSNQNWIDFKEELHRFNIAKNNFYKVLKKNHQENLERKLQLIQIAKENKDSEDWQTAVPLFKKLQEEWKEIGHVPRSQSNRIWDEFRDICNHFFAKVREKGLLEKDDWRINYKKKKLLLEELQKIGERQDSIQEIKRIKDEWNSIGKVPRDKIGVNLEFNRILSSKMKLNKIKDHGLLSVNFSGKNLTDKAIRIKNQITDLESEVSKLENNLAFFSNSNRENPLLKSTYENIDTKKEELDLLRRKLHQIIAEHEQPKTKNYGEENKEEKS